ncbi:MAG: DEAD/DEAH box helicase family protein [Acidobacteria bacterium]|nr:DEAD/DEAH box helicase family protein [Acidobacteriota bacterium]
MAEKPEERARETIDKLLTAAGWIVQSRDEVNIAAGRGVAIREFPLKSGYGFADYLLYVDGAPAGVIEAKKEGETLTGYEIQTEKYSVGLPDELKPYRKPLPFCYQSTGTETRFTNLLEPDARSRQVFAFHRPETFADWLAGEAKAPGSTLRARLRHLPPPDEKGLWAAQFRAIKGLERSLSEGRPRALIQMASGGGKTRTACNFVYRLIKHAGAQRVLFLVDRTTLGRQAFGEFDQFTTPDEQRKFTELYNVQHLRSNKLDPVCKVCITTIQRLYSMLQGEAELSPDDEEAPLGSLESLYKEAIPVAYNPAIPIEYFDFIVVDECHRSIYNLWRQVLEYFDSFIIGLTATPSKQTFGFFNQSLVMEYNHEQAVADNVNVGFDLYRVRTYISEHGSSVEAGLWVDKRDRQTRKVRWEQLDEDLVYGANQLDRDVVAQDQIRTVIQTFRDRLFTEIFPGRREVPKTLIFAKDDNHAEDIVNIVREEFGKGNEFAQKITYRTGTVRVPVKKKLPDGTEIEEYVYKSGGSVTAEDLLASFRNSYFPRIAVTVDMISTGTDVRPLEILLFMRTVRNRNLFEQMKGRGTRVVTPTELQAVTPDATTKTHFIIVDAVGLCETDMADTYPLERKPTVAFEKLLEAVAFGNREKDVLSSLAARLARLNRQLTKEDRGALESLAGGKPLPAITAAIVVALDPDRQVEAARQATGAEEPPEEAVAKAAAELLSEAAKPIAANPKLRGKLIELKKFYEQTLDTVSKDQVVEAGFSPAAKDKARAIVESFEQFIQQHKDEITALQILYSRPYNQRLTLKAIKELAAAIEKPPRGWTPDLLWRAYEALDKSKVRAPGGKVLADIVSLVRFALHQEGELRPFHDQVNERFADWMAQQEKNGRRFTDEQRQWLEAIRDHIAASLAIGVDDFEYVPFVQRGGLGKANQVFGKALPQVLKELNEVLVA